MRGFVRRSHTREIFSIETERLILRIVRPSEANAIAGYLRKNRSFHAPFHQLHEEEYFTAREQREYIRSDLAKYDSQAAFPFWIYTREQPDRVIGRLSFSNIIRGALCSCLVGYHLDEDMTGNGYMREALSAGCAYMFREQRLHRIQADIMPKNIASKNTVTALGFRHQGRNERYMCIAGQWEDHEIYALLNEPDLCHLPDLYHPKESQD